MSLLYGNLYTFLEVTTIDIPFKKQVILDIAGYIDHLFMIADVHSFSAPIQPDVKISRFWILPLEHTEDKQKKAIPRKRKHSLS